MKIKFIKLLHKAIKTLEILKGKFILFSPYSYSVIVHFISRKVEGFHAVGYIDVVQTCPNADFS